MLLLKAFISDEGDHSTCAPDGVSCVVLPLPGAFSTPLTTSPTACHSHVTPPVAMPLCAGFLLTLHLPGSGFSAVSVIHRTLPHLPAFAFCVHLITTYLPRRPTFTVHWVTDHRLVPAWHHSAFLRSSRGIDRISGCAGADFALTSTLVHQRRILSVCRSSIITSAARSACRASGVSDAWRLFVWIRLLHGSRWRTGACIRIGSPVPCVLPRMRTSHAAHRFGSLLHVLLLFTLPGLVPTCARPDANPYFPYRAGVDV